MGLFVAVTVLFLTSGLVLGLSKLNESEREMIRDSFIIQTGDTRNFVELRATGSTGFTHVYLREKLSIENLTTTAVLDIVLDMVKLDLAEGAKPEEIVFGCCWWWPKRDVINAVIEKTGAKIKEVLEYEDMDGVGRPNVR